MPKEKPIIFQTHLAAQIVKGIKTETRRVIVPQPYAATCGKAPPAELTDAAIRMTLEEGEKPYAPGDLLWAKEKWRISSFIDHEPSINVTYGDKTSSWKRVTPEIFEKYGQSRWDWRSGRFMPKWACRLWLEILEIWPERVQEITGDAAVREGVVYLPESKAFNFLSQELQDEYRNAALGMFRETWDILNKKRGFGWKTNPWVWVIKFKRGQRGDTGG